MEDGGWRMEDGGWRMEDGGWRMEEGGWRMEDGGWRMEDGGWRMEDGGWRMEDGGWNPIESSILSFHSPFSFLVLYFSLAVQNSIRQRPARALGFEETDALSNVGAARVGVEGAFVQGQRPVGMV